MPSLGVPVEKSAILSSEPDPLYRYRLDRSWDASRPRMVWIMLNPSTADDRVDDPTIQACMEIARRNRCGAIVVVNLFALRSSTPRVLLDAEDPVGPRNDTFLRLVLVDDSRAGDFVIAAWGTNGGLRQRDAAVRAMVADWSLKLKCIGRTMGGHPKHPLARGKHRVPRDTPLQEFS